MTKPDTFDLKVDFRIPLIELVVLLDENSGEILESVGGKGGGKGGKESPFVLRIEEVIIFILFYFILFYSILFYFILFYFILFYFILFYFNLN